MQSSRRGFGFLNIYLLVFVLFTFSGLIAFLSSVADASALAPAIALMDGPVDYSHPDLLPFLDIEALQRNYVSSVDGSKVSLWQLNGLMRNTYGQSLDHENYSTILDRMDRLSQKTDLSFDFFLTLDCAREVTSQFYRSEFGNFNIAPYSAYAHGTHVAGILVRGLPRARLLNFQMPMLQVILARQPLGDGFFTGYQLTLQRYFSEISAVIERENIRVFNISANFIAEHATFPLLQLTMQQSPALKPAFEQFQNQLIAEFYHQFRLLFRSHPNTLFTISSANQGKSIDQTMGYDLFRIHEPNTLIVGAMDRTGNISPFSNYSPTEVDVAAEGQGVLSARAGGGSLYMSGTSQAAPLVGNSLMRELVGNPFLSGAELRALLMRNHVQMFTPQLIGKVRGGAMLTDPGNIPLLNRCAALLSNQMIQSLSGVSAKTQ